MAGAAVALAELDPEHAARYRANAAALDRRLETLDVELRQKLAPLSEVPYVVFHDAYAYLEERYGLRPVGAVTVAPERPPGARRLAAIRERIAGSGARCVFTEPQFDPKLASLLTEGTGARRAVLDPLGADLAAGPEAYFTLMATLAEALQACLAPTPAASP